jgi:membrane glycosyltransferase
MDALVNKLSIKQDIPLSQAHLPPEQHLDMPIQNLGVWEGAEADQAQKRYSEANKLDLSLFLSRLIVFGGGIALTFYGGYEMYQVISVGPSVTILQWVLWGLFLLNFSWIAIAFSSGVLGFASLMRRPRNVIAVPEKLHTRTAVMMPIYNEAPARVYGAMQAMAEDVLKTGLAAHFDFFFLSDTTDPSIFVAEERAFYALRERISPDIKLYYRHRPKNTARKAGNISDFVTRWGGAYEHMVILDADSLMTGEAITGLAALMERDANAGIIQTLPLIINRNTLFARVQQFAARIYGPVIAEGLRLWMHRDGNYWGHNAIIRTKAFADHCGMPDLTGKPPFGGHILSHDFVEAALIRRAGWAVYMVPGLVGSYEESPPSLIDLAARDRRWCQGNLQHSRVIGSKGFHPATRQHFATGIFGYLASPLWLLQLVVGIALTLQVTYFRPEYFTKEFSLYPTWPRFDAERSLWLFATTMGILLAPKFFGLIVALFDSKTRRGSGGGFALIGSTFVEIFMSALFAPIMMVIQSGAVFEIIVGRDTGWNTQRRDDGTIPLRDIIRRHSNHVLLGVIAGISALLIAPSLAAWMSPTIIGLILAVQISHMSGMLSIGLFLKRFRLLMTPEERNPPQIALDATVKSDSLELLSLDCPEPLRLLHDDETLRSQHINMLVPLKPRPRGIIFADRAIAEAKLSEAHTIDEVEQWLTPKERMIVLHDISLLTIISKLKIKDENVAVELPHKH